MDDQAPAVVDAHELMMNVLEAEEAQGEPEQEFEDEAIEAAPDADDETGEPEVVEEEANEEIIHNGETKLLTKSELKQLAQQGFDYTQKTQAAAEERRSLQAQAQALQVQIAINTQLGEQVAEIKSLDSQIAQYKGINWGELAEQDPVQYLKLNQTYRDLKEAREGMAQEYSQKAQYLTQVQAQNQAQLKQAEMKLLSQKVPELVGAKGAENQRAVSEYLAQKGFGENEIGSILDHRMVQVAWEAAQYAKLKAGKADINKRLAEAPKVVKNKQQVSSNAMRHDDIKSKLRATGDKRLAEKLIESTL